MKIRIKNPKSTKNCCHDTNALQPVSQLDADGFSSTKARIEETCSGEPAGVQVKGVSPVYSVRPEGA